MVYKTIALPLSYVGIYIIVRDYSTTELHRRLRNIGNDSVKEQTARQHAFLFYAPSEKSQEKVNIIGPY